MKQKSRFVFNQVRIWINFLKDGSASIACLRLSMYNIHIYPEIASNEFMYHKVAVELT